MATAESSSLLSRVRQGAADAAFTLKTLHRAGVIGGTRPDKLLRMGKVLREWGASPATGIAVAAIRAPDHEFIRDEAGSLTFSEVQERTNALADRFAELGVGPGDSVGIMCRNHRGFIETTLAAAKLGAASLFLNTMFSGPQLTDVCNRESPQILVHDAEFTELLAGVDSSIQRVVAWEDERDAAAAAAAGDRLTLDALIGAGSRAERPAPGGKARFVVLTSGTTGTPKGAQRSSPDGLSFLAALIDRIPFRAGERMVIAAPLFHSWGFLHFVLSLPLRSTIVLQRRFNEEETLKAIEENEAKVLVVVPIMLQRILRRPAEVLSRYSLPSLRISSVSGSALPGDLATEWMDRYGDNIYNFYGSTEVAYATIADPADLRAAPGTAGRPPHGTVIGLFDENDKPVGPGEVGRIFVGNSMVFDGYTGGGGKPSIDGLVGSGDVGHFDPQGRLFIDGRDDEMIVSGGENVFPREVEDLLAAHEAVTEVAVIGVEDEEFGQRLKAYVVSVPGAELGEVEVKSHVKANLAAYKSPREVVFLDELPRNATGKIVKRDLK